MIEQAPTSATRSTAERLRELEVAAAATPQDVKLRSAALDELREGRASDRDVGASACVDGAKSLSVAVVTPYFREDLAVLRRCHESVLAQTYSCRHIMIADGAPRDEIDAWEVEHIRLPAPCADYGDTPRATGGERARALGCTAIAYLDADNTFRPRHVESMVGRHAATGAPVIFSGRTWHFPDGRMLPVIDPADGRVHVDTSCLFLAGDLATVASVWVAYPRPLALIDDRMVLRILRARGLRFACTGALTLRYTAHFAWMYRALKLPVPVDARPDFDVRPAAAYLRTLSTAQWAELDRTLGTPVVTFLRNLLERHPGG